MVFLALAFVTLNLITLFKGSLLYGTSYKLKEITIKQYENKLTDEEFKNESVKILFSLLMAMTWIITQITFYLNALFIDQLKLLTIGMIVIMVLEVLMGTLKKTKSKITNNEDLEEFKKQLYTLKKHSFNQKVYALLCIAYFSYSFYILVFQ